MKKEVTKSENRTKDVRKWIY